MERPVDRLHSVVGEDDHGRLLVPALSRGVDQLAAGAVDGLIDLDQLVPRVRWVVCRMARVEPVVTEVAGVIGAHEVDAEEAEIGVDLERQPADVGDLADMLDQAPRVPVEVLPPALRHRVPRGEEVGMEGKDAVTQTGRQHLRRLRSAVAGDDGARQGLGRVGERHGDERRAEPGGAERPPEGRAGTGCGALHPVGAAVRVRGEVEDAVPGRVQTREEGRPGRRRHRRNRGAKRAVGTLAREPGDGRHPSLAEERADEVVVGAVDPEDEHLHAATSSRYSSSRAAPGSPIRSRTTRALRSP